MTSTIAGTLIVICCIMCSVLLGYLIARLTTEHMVRVIIEDELDYILDCIRSINAEKKVEND